MYSTLIYIYIYPNAQLGYSPDSKKMLGSVSETGQTLVKYEFLIKKQLLFSKHISEKQLIELTGLTFLKTEARQ